MGYGNALYLLGLFCSHHVIIATNSQISRDFTAAANRLKSACPKKSKISLVFVIN